MTKRKKVLIADNEVDLCLLMKTYFLRKNYEVYITHTCYDAITKATELQPDYIFISKDICDDPDRHIQQLKETAPNAEVHPIESGIPKDL